MSTQDMVSIPGLPLVSPTGWWWLILADDDGFLGCVVIEGSTQRDAVQAATRLDINPGGECLGVPCRSINTTPESWRNRLLTWSECDELDRVLGATRWN